MTDFDAAQAFADMITKWDTDKVLDYFARSVASNSFGNNDEQIAIARNEIKSRIAS